MAVRQRAYPRAGGGTAPNPRTTRAASGLSPRRRGNPRHWAAGGARTGVYDVLPECWPAIRTWMAVCDQWRVGPWGGALGLDWPAVEVLARIADMPLDAERLDALRVMEGAALEVWAERRATS